MRIKNQELRIKLKNLYSLFLPLNSYYEDGQVLILTIIALGVVLFTVLFIISGAQIYFQNALYSANAEKATALAEAGVDKALVSLNKTGGAYNGEAETSLGDGTYSVEVTDKDAVNKVLKVTGYIPNKANAKTKRTITIQSSKGVGISFVYGMQVGDGGLQMGNGSTLNGSVYSNGNISGGNNSNFTGDVWVAGAGQLAADQENDCFGANCTDFIFGKNVGGENRQDTAQSFRPSSDGNLNKVSLKLKKIGSPANPTVRIMTDAGGKPNKNGVLATGTLLANLVTGEYSFVDVTFNATPGLDNDNTYWIMIHAGTLDSSNYWVWSNDLAQGYSRGVPKWSPNWQAGSPSWNAISGDLGFKAYLGGAATSLALGTGSLINGDVHANTISGSMTVNGDAFYQTIAPAVTVNGTRNPESSDPAPVVFPISDANIQAWKLEASSFGVIGVNISGCNMNLGPGEITGSVAIGNSCRVTVKTPIWIKGALSAGNSTKFILDSSFGPSSGVIIVDGRVSLGNGNDLLGSGTEGSFLMLLSTYNTSAFGGEAIETGNSSISGILYAPYGSIELSNGTSFKELTAWKVELGNNAVLNYQTGLASAFFSSGPSGSFSLVKGTYQIK